MIEWKNIKESKPLFYKIVIVYSSSAGICHNYRLINNGEQEYFVNHDQIILNDVTHWMEPLKAPNNTNEKLSDTISRTETSIFAFVYSDYVYKFQSRQYLEKDNNYKIFGIIQDNVDEILIDYLCSGFRTELEKIIKKR